ncbi:MAG: F0F1 ATP synthase subunit delta [Gammaproteobacteria bacterium]
MQLDWTTFILEIVNFLVLVWILRRFLYRPVMNVVAQRRAAITQDLQAAQATQEQAKSLQAQYENRLADWQQEREMARQQLRDEIEAERQKLLAQLQTELAEQRHKEQVLAQRRDENLLREARHQAQALTTQFAARLLGRLAAPDLEERLLQMLLEDLPRLPEAQRKTLAAAQRDSQAPVQVSSAFPMNEAQRQALGAALQQTLDTAVACEFLEDPALLAGVSVHIGSHYLQANLKEELRFFGDVLRHED